MDITDARYNTKTGIKTCPSKNQSYCGQEFGSPQEFKTHEKQHAGQVWACFECNKESKGKVRTSALFINTTGPNMIGGTCTSALLPPVSLMATHMVMMNSTLYGGICRRTMACSLHWVVPNVMGPSAVSKHSKNIYQAAQAKKIGLAQNKPLMLRKDLNVISVQRNTPHRLHYSSTRRCTKALTRSMCAACVAKLSAQQQPCTNMKRYIKVTKVFKPNFKF